MSAFTDFAAIRPGGFYGYRLGDDLEFDIGKAGSGMVYVVPSGFWFDVSIPRFARWFFNPNDYRYLKAAAIHDHMLIEGWDRQTAAAVFYRALRASYVPTWRAVTMYLAVSFWSLINRDPTVKKGDIQP